MKNSQRSKIIIISLLENHTEIATNIFKFSSFVLGVDENGPCKLRFDDEGEPMRSATFHQAMVADEHARVLLTCHYWFVSVIYCLFASLFVWVLWHINFCRLFYAKFILYR